VCVCVCGICCVWLIIIFIVIIVIVQIKKLILDTVGNTARLCQLRKQMGFDDVLQYGKKIYCMCVCVCVCVCLPFLSH